MQTPYNIIKKYVSPHLAEKFKTNFAIKVEKLEDGTYTVAVGERGSDVSVNLFGMDEYPTKTIDGTVVYRNYADFGSEPSGSSSLKFRSHRRYIPEYLP